MNRHPGDRTPTDIKVISEFFTIHPEEPRMIDLQAATTSAVADTASPLDAITQAYAAGDAPSGELLHQRALDLGLPWDRVCAAAARGIAQRYDRNERG
jgi:hypothetical protein